MAYPSFIAAGGNVSVPGYGNAAKTVPWPSGTQAGDYVVLVGSYGAGSGSLDITGGFSLIVGRTNGDGTGISVYGKFFANGDIAPTAHPGGRFISNWQAFSFRAVDSATPFEGARQSDAIESDQTINIPAASSAIGEVLQLVVAGNTQESAPTYTVNNPLTQIYQGGVSQSYVVATANGPASAGGVPAKTIGTSSTGIHANLSLLIRPASVSPPVDTPVSFSGTVPNQSATVGTAFSLNLSSYFSGSLTPFAYSLIAGSLTGTGLSLNTSTGVISGTPTSATTISGLQVRATDSASNTAQTNTFSITVQAAGIGSAVTYTVPSRTFAAAVTASAPTVAGLSFAGLCDNMGITYNSGTLAVRIYNQSTGSLITTKTATVANGGSAVVTDAALVVGTAYDCWLQLGTGEYGAVKVVAA